jgi:chromosome segregation ATPase
MEKKEILSENELALSFYNVNYSGTQTSEFLKPYIINTFKAARLAKLQEIEGLKSDKERLIKACDAIQASRNELDQLLSAQSREIEELQASKENLIKIAEQFQKNASEITKECFKLKNEITDLKAESERFKSELEKKNKITP